MAYQRMRKWVSTQLAGILKVGCPFERDSGFSFLCVATAALTRALTIVCFSCKKMPPATGAALDKQYAAIATARSSDKYMIVFHLLPAQFPREPNPLEMDSKRQWEAAMRNWRAELRRLAGTVDLSL